MREWSERGPEISELSGRRLPDALRQSCEELARSGKLEILELSQGLRIRTKSWVGRLELGDLVLTIEPKLPRAPLDALLRYAYGLRELHLHTDTAHAALEGGIRDLLVQKLVDEAEEVFARGLHRDYDPRVDNLASPRGKILFGAYAGVASRARAELPCVHYPRTEANLINISLLGAIVLGANLASDPGLRHRAARLARSIAIGVPRVLLSLATLDQAEAVMDRRHRAYQPAFRLARLLLEGVGTSLEPGTPSVPLPGFLFDMNRFFQTLLFRFMSEHLLKGRIETEQVLSGMFGWENSPTRRAPRPRPDFIIKEGGRVLALLDAKYRDLSATPLPREMLYQLTLYALAHRGRAREAVILYPVLGTSPVEEAVVLHDPFDGRRIARVVLRPVNLNKFSAAVTAGKGRRQTLVRQTLAAEMAFGNAAYSA